MQNNLCLISKNSKIFKLKKKERMLNSNDELKKSLIKIDKRLQI